MGTKSRTKKAQTAKEALTGVRSRTAGNSEPPTNVNPSRREQILDAAITVFSTRGYRATLVDEIAQEAGLAKGTLYLYFQSKEQMYMEALRENLEKLHRLTVARLEQAPSTWDKIKALIVVRLEFGKTHKRFLRIYLSEFAVSYSARGKWLERIRELAQRDTDLLQGVFEKGIKAGEVRAAPPEQLVAILQSMLRGMMASRLIEMRSCVSEPDPELIVDLLRKGFGTSN